MTRRLVALAALLTLGLAGAPHAAAVESGAGTGTAPPTATPIRHFVYLMQESHSFDEYFGTYPGADGIPEGVCLPRRLAEPEAGCVEPSLRVDRSPVEVRHVPGLVEAQSDGGRMDGFVSAVADQPGAADSVMAHYNRSSLGWYWGAADHFVLFDRFFSSSTGGHVANHLSWMTGSSGPSTTQDAVPEGGWGDDIPTVFDRLQAAGVPWKVYVGGLAAARANEAPTSAAELTRVPLLAMPRFRDDPELAARIVDLSQYYEDAESDALPAVAFIVPSGATTERAPADVDVGQTMARSLVNELMRSSAWDSSAFLLSYDTGGGSYDHVPPPADGAWLGPRVPALLVSPYVPAGQVVHTPLDSGSALRFISENWGVPLPGDAGGRSTSLATALDFTSSPRAPELVPSVAPQAGRRSVSTASLYPAYGLALLVPVVVAGSTAWRARRRRRPV